MRDEKRNAATDDDDDDFLSLVEAAEARALLLLNNRGANKRIKTEIEAKPQSSTEEGSYLAALRGSKSSLWQQQQQQRVLHSATNRSGDVRADAGACFKCGMAGHWARDCTAPGGGGGALVRGIGLGDGGGGGVDEVPDKECPCGIGICSVLTSNTAKNPGRKFYRCPVKEENGGCKFFEWCDNQSLGVASSASPNPLAPGLQCPCGAGTCLVLTARTGKNAGQNYYRCPADQGGACGFFKWCNQQNLVDVPTSIPDNANFQSSGGRAGSSCFRCGQEGHWSRDCPMSSSDSHEMRGNRSGSLRTCFNCGKTGHWARDCPTQAPISSTGKSKLSDSSRSPYDYGRK